MENVELIARRFSIDELKLLRQKYGGRNWRKLKVKARVELLDGEMNLVELHWYERASADEKLKSNDC